MKQDFCKLGNRPCDHCSHETYREVERTPDFKLHKIVIAEKVIPLGEYCNNICAWVNDLKECPVPAALEVCRQAILHPVDTCNPLEWMRNREKMAGV